LRRKSTIEPGNGRRQKERKKKKKKKWGQQAGVKERIQANQPRRLGCCTEGLCPWTNETENKRRLMKKQNTKRAL